MTIHWHREHAVASTRGAKAADAVASFMGSWTFIGLQSVFVAVWIVANVVGFAYQWDAWPFIFLNLLFSTQAAYAAPVIMMAQNRQSERDRHHAEADYQVNLGAKIEIERLQNQLAQLEVGKLDRIIEFLGA